MASVLSEFPKMSKAGRNRVAFAWCCKQNGFDPVDLESLCILARRAFKAGERECNAPDFDGDPARKRFELAAQSMDLRVKWPGLYPSCSRVSDGAEVRLPL